MVGAPEVRAKKMRVLVTGSSGHLGEGLIRTFRRMEHEYEAVGLDILPSPFTDLMGTIADDIFCQDACSDIDVIIHTATLHKPHVATHTKQDFIDTNVTGTLNLLQAAVSHGIKTFIFTSTTSTFGDALRPGSDEPAAWVTEDLQCRPKNIYGVTKTSAEDMCQLFARNHGMNIVILRTSRFFPEADDNRHIRAEFSLLNSKANELLYRRVDVQDAVDAHLLAIKKAPEIGFDKFIISATTPFSQADLTRVRKDLHDVVKDLYPENFERLYSEKTWKMARGIDRVYVNEKARQKLGWKPRYDFQHVLHCLKTKQEFRSPLSLEIGSKGYHHEGSESWNSAPYPVDHSSYCGEDPVVFKETQNGMLM